MRAIAHAEDIIQELRGNVIENLSFPFFYKTVQVGENGLCITDDLMQKKLFQLVRDFEKLKLQVA